MKAHAELLSYKKDGHTLCWPSTGYSQETVIELEHYEEIGTIRDSLPPSDEIFPKGAPVTDHVKVGNKLFKRRPR